MRPPLLTADVSAIEIDTNNVKRENFSIRIEDFISLNMRPLLNYVFFDDSSSVIPDRYTRLDSSRVASFDIKKLQDLNAVETYYHVLNITGKRLRSNPDARITLVGCNSDTGPERNNRGLSRDRAEAVRDYLVDVWGIEKKRIRISARDLPRQPSRSDEPGVDAENRRVEIISRDLSIVEPVMTVDTLRILSTTKVRFLPEVKSEAGIESWELVASQGDKKLKKFTGKNTVPKKLDWVIKQNGDGAPGNVGHINYRFEVSDTIGQKYGTKRHWLPIEKITLDRKKLERVEDKEFEYYSLILFDYGKARLGSEHRKVINFVKKRLRPEAKVIVYGHSDRIGEEDVNKRLSEKRAKAVARMLRIPDAQVIGMGENNLLYDNNLPEGRFYCRTVRIEVITPVTDNGD